MVTIQNPQMLEVAFASDKQVDLAHEARQKLQSGDRQIGTRTR